MKRKTAPVLVFSALLLLLLSAVPARAQMSPPVLQSVLRIESHSDNGNPDDYVYKMISLSRQLEGGVIGNVFYVYKHNMSEGNVGGHIAGLNVIKMFSDETMLNIGYSYNKYDESSTRTYNYDQDRWLLGLYHYPIKKKNGTRLRISAVHSSQTDWSESRSLDLGVGYRAYLGPRWHGAVGYKYTHGLGSANTHLLNQWNVDFSYQASKLITVDFGYLFVNKVFSVPSPGAQPEDDHVFRLGMKYTYK